MIKAVFIDHMGTMVTDKSKYALALIQKCWENSNMGSIEETYRYWLDRHEELMGRYYDAAFKPEYEIALETFQIAGAEIGLRGDCKEYADMLTLHWKNTPAFPDTEEFFRRCPLPIYLVTNNDNRFIEENMRNNHLEPAGIISSEKARFYKPKKEIFLKALEEANVSADEVIHVGDSLIGDIEGAARAGIRALLLDREGKEMAGESNIIRINSLLQVLDYI